MSLETYFQNSYFYIIKQSEERKMITVGMNYNVVSGKEQTFETAFTGVLKALDSTPGHVKSNLLKDVHNPQSYHIISEWNNEEDFNTFITSEKFRNVANWGKEQILSTRPSHQVYKESTPIGS